VEFNEEEEKLKLENLCAQIEIQDGLT